MSTAQDETEIGPEDTDPEQDIVVPSLHGKRIHADNVESGMQPAGIAEILERVRGEDQENGDDIHRPKLSAPYKNIDIGKDEHDTDTLNGDILASPVGQKPSSADGSLSTPDDTPSNQNSLLSSPGRYPRSLRRAYSPSSSLRPFDRRFQTRLSSSPLTSPRATSPAFLNVQSRQHSALGQIGHDGAYADTPKSPWEVVRWTRLRKISGQAFSEIGKRNFGRPTCLAVSASIAIGTSKGMILIFDYHQTLKTTLGPGTQGSGSVTSIAFSADDSTIAGGHANGAIFTWEIARPAKPFLQIVAVDGGRSHGSDPDGHIAGAAILHLGFLGTRHTAIVSADDKGMAFSHFATRGMGAIARSMRTTRILGRYPELGLIAARAKKPSSVLAFSPLPLGNAELVTDEVGLVAMLTPYLLVIVSTIPVAQTQHKANRPKEIAAHSTMSAALAWFPSMKPDANDDLSSEDHSRAKLAYSWSSVLTVLELHAADPPRDSIKEKHAELHFIPRNRWKAEEAIVAIQWLTRSVLCVITVSQQLIILEDASLRATDSLDLIKKHVYHADLFSQQLSQLVESLDEEDTSMHGVVADAFYMSFKAYKGRLFLLGFSEVSMGTMSNWADRLLALMEEGNFIGAIELATSYYNGVGERGTVGLPEQDALRHAVVQEKLLEMMSASLKYAFGKNQKAKTSKLGHSQLEQLATACFAACLSLEDNDFLYEDVYNWYLDEHVQGIFLQILERCVKNGAVKTIPAPVLKDLIDHFMKSGRDAELEEALCRLNPETMDIDQVTTLCKKHRLYDALFYVWNQALGDYTTILNWLMEVRDDEYFDEVSEEQALDREPSSRTSKIFLYLSYILTGRVYPTGEAIDDPKATIAKSEVYDFLFSSKKRITTPISRSSNQIVTSLSHLRRILELDAPSFLSMLNEAFEDNFLNGSNDTVNGLERQNALTDEQRFGLSLNRQFVVGILLEVMVPPEYDTKDIVYLDMFIARNLPKFPQFILLPGSTLHRVLTELCKYSHSEIAEDCQLSAEYLLSVYQPPDLPSMIPILSEARFYRIIKAVYISEGKYAQLLETCFEDRENPEALFECVSDCLRSGAGLSFKQREDVRGVIIEHAVSLIQAGLTQAASLLNDYAPDLHKIMLDTIHADEHAQYQYLREVIEPSHPGRTGDGPKLVVLEQNFTEQYVRLLCDYDPHHVSEFIEQLNIGDLRLEEVLPALEERGVVDTAVVLLSREGKTQEGIFRLTRHIKTLGAALTGLLDGAQSTPDAANTQEAIDDLIESLQKYIRIGVWLCQSQSKSPVKVRAEYTYTRRPHSATQILSLDEELWLELIDVVVKVTRDISDGRETQGDANGYESSNTDLGSPGVRAASTWKPLKALRAMVQETFTVLLTATSVPSANDGRQKELSFLRIFRSFLGRISLSSPSISYLRGVLSAIFSAYSYEESLLGLANRLLDKDVFVHVSEITSMRRRGWRPLGQVCEGCGKRAWGPGAGGEIWDAWVEASQAQGDTTSDTRVISSMAGNNGKGKAVMSRHKADDISEQAISRELNSKVTKAGDSGSLIVFACRHIFHRKCVHSMRGPNGRHDVPDAEGLEFSCPLCK
ncbi:Vacuolar protein sorting-associated protein 8 [Lambiella insularis]|nr:Vacuolar protein sorting-associated protein 8 [Lambiella insularis]